MIGDYYTPETRTRGLSFFNLGAGAGATLGLALIGVIADQFGWRVAFFSSPQSTNSASSIPRDVVAYQHLPCAC